MNRSLLLGLLTGCSAGEHVVEHLGTNTFEGHRYITLSIKSDTAPGLNWHDKTTLHDPDCLIEDLKQ